MPALVMRRYKGDSYRPPHLDDGPPRAPAAAADSMYRFGSGQRPRKDFPFKPRISERDLLTRLPTSSETPVFAPGQTGHKFRDVENLTDSEEEEMDEDISDDEGGARRAKKRKTETGSKQVSAMKWSNPDPYTALPPAQDSTAKSFDVVRLIRKARNDSQPRQNTVVTEDDFISFENFDEEYPKPPPNAPAGPKSAIAKLDKPVSTQTLGKRKRDDFLRDNLIGPKGRAFHANGQVLAVWRAGQNISSSPWLEKPCPTDSPMVALHKEILDFYAWIRPRDFEAMVRDDLVNRLTKELKRYKGGCRLQSFGSYAAGLYLPTGDMDLVCFVPDAPIDSFPLSKSQMYRISSFLERCGLVRPGSMQVIAKAKVPILKFVDHATGLKVDLSFNNTTGTKAVETFERWQAAYPAMPILVAVIKQFLMIRGLNDNSVGGLGGFATICLVTSLVQNLPTTKYQNLGELLLEFFNLYGNLFAIENVGIRLDPPGYVDKWGYSPLNDEKSDRLMIIDPNRPDNNITGGSSEIKRIFDLFSRTHGDLQARLDDFADPGQRTANFSFLEGLIGGNFSAYYEQRHALHAVYAASNVSRGGMSIPPPPSLPPPIPPPPPSQPDRSARSSQATNDNESPLDKPSNANDNVYLNKAERRLERVRRLCPELAPQLEKKKGLSTKLAMHLGGWETGEEMDRELTRRENEASKKTKT